MASRHSGIFDDGRGNYGPSSCILPSFSKTSHSGIFWHRLSCAIFCTPNDRSWRIPSHILSRSLGQTRYGTSCRSVGNISGSMQTKNIFTGERFFLTYSFIACSIVREFNQFVSMMTLGLATIAQPAKNGADLVQNDQYENAECSLALQSWHDKVWLGNGRIVGGIATFYVKHSFACNIFTRIFNAKVKFLVINKVKYGLFLANSILTFWCPRILRIKITSETSEFCGQFISSQWLIFLRTTCKCVNTQN